MGRKACLVLHAGQFDPNLSGQRGSLPVSEPRFLGAGFQPAFLLAERSFFSARYFSNHSSVAGRTIF